MTWRRLLLLGSASTLFLFLVFTLTPIVSPLPRYTGPHEVGVLDVETEVERRRIWDARIKETGEPAFDLNTLAITLYYPSIPRPKTPGTKQPLARPWLPQPISLIGTGYARMLGIHWPPAQSLLTGILWLLGSSTVIPGIVDAPLIPASDAILVDPEKAAIVEPSEPLLKDADESKEDMERLEVRRNPSGTDKLPVVVFSHGMAGMSQSYSHYLGSIASHGYVVAAVEHRDGSGPGTIEHYANGTSKSVWHLQLQDLEADPPMTLSTLKTAQLSFREAEILETINFFSLLNSNTDQQKIKNLKPDSPEKTLPTFSSRLDLSQITIIGHSYGATGALQALRRASKSKPQASKNNINLPTDATITGGISLDPGKASGPLNTHIPCPLLVLQSGEWTNKAPSTDFYGLGPHWRVVRDLVANVPSKKGWFMTIPGTAHPSVTDAPLIVPWIMKMVTGTTLDAKTALEEYVDVSVRFLEYLRSGRKEGVLASEVTSEKGPLGKEGERGVVDGEAGGKWEVHVVPEE
ncbi:hypothetical protein M011DRAFT_467314 [Sporormia fimetaria CBS 119925]|uniref:Putative phospholipase n=1 Tax=Sporormia fimetaria CBS 119925 TaxID=1340428 RepID=A0A6A6VEV4_9PLEO|nr:hypothetical protein M011DRAFT_467314 [Sporormia fimetaria CBS 119925]